LRVDGRIGAAWITCWEGSSEAARSASACSTQIFAALPLPIRAAGLILPAAIQFDTADGPRCFSLANSPLLTTVFTEFHRHFSAAQMKIQPFANPASLEKASA
jgi:hypothetical protein